MDYYLYKIQMDQEWSEIVLAFLGELPFDTFEEQTYGIDAYIPVPIDTVAVENELKELQTRFNFEFTKTKIISQNWNQVWESNFSTVLVNDFCGVRADFHPIFENVTHEIIINPKMAFGTGHHATTYMMISLMESINFEGKEVLDYGCGTGILAILAAKMKAKLIDAVDIEKAAYENTLENNQRNEVPDINCFHGTLENVDCKKYDIILANINRNVILDSFSSLYQRLKPGGILLSSGYLLEDQEMMTNAHRNHSFLPDTIKNNGKWISTKAFKRYP